MFQLKQVSLIALLVASAYSAPQLGLDLEAEAPADEFINVSDCDFERKKNVFKYGEVRGNFCY